MIKSKIYGFLKLIRLGVSLFGCITVLISGILSEDLKNFQIKYLITLFLVFLSAAGAFSLNDYYDFEVDKFNNRTDRPLVLELISRRTALLTAIFSFILVVIFSTLLNVISMIFVLINLLLFYLYSMRLKKIIFFKNLLIAYSYVATIFLGSLISDAKLEPIIIYFAMMAFVVGLANEIMFDIADIEGDKKSGIKTLPTQFGAKKVSIVSIILYSLVIILDPLPFFLKIDERLHWDFYFLAFILVPVFSYIFLIRSLRRNQSKENVSKLRIYVFIIMQIGTIAYLTGVLI